MTSPLLSAAVAALALVTFVSPAAAGGLDAVKQGQAAERAGNRNEALRAYTEAIQAGDLTGTQLAFAYYRRGSVRGFLGDNVNGIADYSKSLELNPKLGAAWSLRGYLRGVVGQYDLADQDHRAAIDLAGEQTADTYLPWVLQHYADLWRRRGEFDRALATCERALAAKEYPTVFFRRAWIYLDMGKTAQARTEFERFEQAARQQQLSYDVFWPDERGALSRLRELR